MMALLFCNQPAAGDSLMNSTEIEKVQRFLRQRFANHEITLKKRAETADSAEFLLHGETLGIVFRDDEDGDVCYHVQLTVLNEDLTA